MRRKNTPVRLENSTLERIDQIAAGHGTNRSAVIRMAIHALIKSFEAQGYFSQSEAKASQPQTPSA